MKKFLVIILCVCFIPAVFAKTDNYSAEYLKNKKHFSITKPFVESLVEKKIEKAMAKTLGNSCDVTIRGYSVSSMKKGIIKDFGMEGKDLTIEGVDVPYLRINSLTDYNYIDYTQKPMVYKSDMTYAYTIKLSENSINQALDKKDYQKTLRKVNALAYPLFVLNDVQIKIKNNKLQTIMSYNFPLFPTSKNKTFAVSSSLKVENHKILADKITFNGTYANITPEKVANLLNLLDPLSFTLSIMNTKKCNTVVENVKIVDNIIEIDGKIYVKGE